VGFQCIQSLIVVNDRPSYRSPHPNIYIPVERSSSLKLSEIIEESVWDAEGDPEYSSFYLFPDVSGPEIASEIDRSGIQR
jgi:hypothetical protein